MGILGLRLGLRNVNDGTAHATNEDHAALGLALHQVPSDGGGEQVSAVDVDGPEFAHAVDGVVGGLEVLGESGRGDEVVDLAVLLDHAGDAVLDRPLVGDVAAMGGHLGDPRGRQIQLSAGLTVK